MYDQLREKANEDRLGSKREDGRTWREFFIEELLKIKTKKGKIEPLKANRVQLEYSARPGGKHLVLKARQMGITTWVAAGFFLETIAKSGTTTMLVAHEMRASQDMFRIVERFWRGLPAELKKGILKPSRANAQELVFPEMESEYRVDTAGDLDVGRGLTIQNLHCSEVARWPSEKGATPASTLASLRAAVVPSGQIVLESTANGAEGCFYEEWLAAHSAGYEKHFYPWWYESSYSSLTPVIAYTLSEEEKRLMAKHRLTEQQIAYRRDLKQTFRNLMPQEYAEDAETCFLRSGDCYFDMQLIKTRAEHLGRVDRPLSIVNGLTTWLPPRENRKYIIGVDTSAGTTDGDHTCAQVIDAEKGLQVAELHGRIKPRDTALRVAELGRKYNNALVAVERNNHGHAVIAFLQSEAKYKNLYCADAEPGWHTTHATRAPLVAHMAAFFSTLPKAFKSVELLREMRHFVRRKNGSYGASPGTHDDRVIAMAIALIVREETGAAKSPQRNHG